MARRKMAGAAGNGATVAPKERTVGWRWKSPCGKFGVLHIDSDGTACDYFCRYLGDGKWLVNKLVSGNERIYLVQATRDKYCTCDGHCAHGHCKHAEAFAALLESGAY